MYVVPTYTCSELKENIHVAWDVSARGSLDAWENEVKRTQSGLATLFMYTFTEGNLCSGLRTAQEG